MKKLILYITLSSLLSANFFQVSDMKGNILSNKKIKHKENYALTQDIKEFSREAIYIELHREEKIAKKAAYAKEKYIAIKKKKEASKKIGKVYKYNKLDKDALIEYAKYFKGGKYIWGGTTPKGFDCSGYVQYLYKKHNVNLPRTAWSQSKKGTHVNKKDLIKGDLVFFLTDKKRGIPVTHVGIYMGKGKFIHAASKKKGIIISSLFTGYYSKKFVSAKRMSL